MADVQVAVRLGREARLHATAEGAGLDVGPDKVVEIRTLQAGTGGVVGGAHGSASLAEEG